MGKGRRYDEPKLNIKKVVGVIVGIIVFIMVIVSISKLVKRNQSISQLTVTSYFSALENGKWGVIDNKGNVIIEPTYDEMFIIPNNQKGMFISVYDVDQENGTYRTKVVNENNQIIFSQYEVVEPIDNYEKSKIWYEDNVLRVKANGKYGLIDYKGDKILDTVYDEIYSLKGVKNSLIIKKDGYVGLCNNYGSIIIDPIYKNIQATGKSYETGYIITTTSDKNGVIGIDKSIILEPEYSEIRYLGSKTIYAIRVDERMYLFDSTTKTTFPIGYDSIESMNGENVIIINNQLYGIVDKQGAQKVPTEYEYLKYAFGNYYVAKKDGKYGIINGNGDVAIELKYKDIIANALGEFIQADVDDVNSIILNSNLEQKISGIISEINEEKGYIKVRIGEEYKYYNFKLEEKSSKDIFLTNTLFLRKENGKYGYVDRDGKIVIDYIYDDAKEQNAYGYCAVQKNGKWGSINSNGNIEQDTTIDLSNNLYIDFIGNWHLNITGDYYTRG